MSDQTTNQNKKLNAQNILSTVAIIVSLIVASLVGAGVLSPQQGTQITGLSDQLITQISRDLNLSYTQVQTALSVEVGSSFYGLQQPYSYVIGHPLGDLAITGMQNGTTGAFDYWSTNGTRIEQLCIGNLTVGGGSVLLKEIQHNASVTVPSNVLVVQQYQGSIIYFGNVASSQPSQSYSFMIYPDGANYTAKASNGTVYYSSTNATYVINTALGALTAGRVYQQTVSLVGNFLLTNQILVPSYTILDLKQASLTLANSANSNIISNANWTIGNTQITILGGSLNGNKAYQSLIVSPFELGNGISFAGVSNSTIDGVTISNTIMHGILCDGSDINYGATPTIPATDNVIKNNHLNNIGMQGLAYTTQAGIILFDYASNNLVTDNFVAGSITSPANAIGLKAEWYSCSNTFSNNFVSGYTVSSNHGVDIATYCGFNIVDANQISNGSNGVWFGTGVQNTVFSNNIIVNMSAKGLFDSAITTNIFHNTITNCGDNSIEFNSCINDTVKENTISQSLSCGISLAATTGVSIDNNYISGITAVGIQMYLTNQTMITNNHIFNCVGLGGILLNSAGVINTTINSNFMWQNPSGNIVNWGSTNTYAFNNWDPYIQTTITAIP